MITRNLIAVFICCTSAISAQKLSEFYTNGQKSYEGEFTYILNDKIFNETDNRFDNMDKIFDEYYDHPKQAIKNVKNGNFTSWYKNGNKKEIGTYIMDVPHGKFEFYFENGNKMATGEFHYGFRIGNWTTYYENGNKKMEGNFANYSNKELDSIFTSTSALLNNKKSKYNYYNYDPLYNENTKIEHAQKWKDTDVEAIESKLAGNYSKKNGQFNFYRENGQIEYECFYNNNLKHGKWLFYFPNSKLSKELIFESDSCKGKAVEYYETGNKLYEGNVKAGIEVVENVWDEKGEQIIKNGTGQHIQLYDNGKIRVKRYYKNGLMDKTWYWYRLDGSLDQEAVYKEGKIQSQIFYDTSSRLSEEYFYENDELKRSRKYEDGKLIDEYNK